MIVKCNLILSVEAGEKPGELTSSITLVGKDGVTYEEMLPEKLNPGDKILFGPFSISVSSEAVITREPRPGSASQAPVPAESPPPAHGGKPLSTSTPPRR